MTRRDLFWPVIAACLAMLSAAAGYRCEPSCIGTEANDDFEDRWASLAEASAWQRPQAVRAAYNLGKLDGVASERRRAAGQPAETASCLACHINGAYQPEIVNSRDPFRAPIGSRRDHEMPPAQ